MRGGSGGEGRGRQGGSKMVVTLCRNVLDDVPSLTSRGIGNLVR